MIAFIHKSHAYDHDEWQFIDFEDLSDDVIQTLMYIKNHDYDCGNSPWSIEALFATAEQKHNAWYTFFDVHEFFDYREEYGPRRGSWNGRQLKEYLDIVLLTATNDLPLEVLQQLVKWFRDERDNDAYDYEEDDPPVIFTPLFEQEVGKRMMDCVSC